MIGDGVTKDAKHVSAGAKTARKIALTVERRDLGPERLGRYVPTGEARATLRRRKTS